MVFQVKSIFIGDASPVFTWYQIYTEIHSSCTAKLFHLAVSTSLPWFPSLRTRSVEAGRSRPTASPFFTLSVATGCQVSRSAKFHPGVVMLAFPLARRLRSKPWCRPSPAPHDSLPGPASRTCQAVRRFLSHVIAQCLPILCAEVVSQARNQTIPVLTALHAKAEPTLQIFTDQNRPAPSACVPPRGE